ncbi:hypothetical protein RCR19_17055 [Streptomyces sp. WAC07094]|uniref:hypothetical protein n=1 Tax=Streptomyces sp. WAC07094 TaxID=3072183 RepID=UPI002E9AEB7B|nr:hypothetical protein [Streptomyces sp. WAC07094]
MSTFKREADMLRPLTESRHKFTSPRTPWEYFYEIQTPKGVADLVLAVFNRQVIEDRRKWRVHPIQSKSAIDVIAFLTASHQQWEAGSRTSPAAATSEIATHTLTSTSHLTQQLMPMLIEYGWVERPGRGQWKVRHPYQCPTTSIYAIEVKRSDWQRALGQAIPHANFANKTFLAMDEARLPKVKENLLSALSHAGVGLLSLSADRLKDPLEVIANPSRRSPKSTERFVVAERLLAVRGSGGNSGFWGHVFGRLITTSNGEDPRNSKLLLT